MLQKIPKKWLDRISLLWVVAFVLFGARPLFQPGLYTAHDIWHQVARLYHFNAALSAGLFPPLWVPALAHGLGYPLFYFSYHLPWFIGALFIKFGLAFDLSLKASFLVAYLTAGIGMYLFLKHLLKTNLVAFVGAVTYVISPYFFFNLYVAAAIGPIYVMAALPFLFLAVNYLYQGRYRQGILLFSFWGAVACLSHLITFLMSLCLVLIYALVIYLPSSPHQLKRFKALIVSMLLLITLTAYYLIPFLAYSPLIKASQGSSGFDRLYLANFVNLSQLIYSKWGFAPVAETAASSQLSFQVGIIQWLGVIGLIILWILNRFGFNFKFPTQSLFFVFGYGLTLFLITPQSRPLWDLLAHIYSLDYPFRLLSLATFLGSVGLSLSLQAGLLRYPRLAPLLVIGILTLTLYTNRNHIRINQATQIPLSNYLAAETTTNTFHEYLPLWANGGLLKEEPPPLIDPPLMIESYYQNPIETVYQLTASQSGTYALHQFDFPGQSLSINGRRKVDSGRDGFGRMTLDLEPGEYTLRLTHQPEMIVWLGRFISLSGILIWLYLFRKSLT